MQHTFENRECKIEKAHVSWITTINTFITKELIVHLTMIIMIHIILII
jgi:hypothetical protein